MALSVYVHIPYCIQRCKYCDFATFEWSEILPPEQYVDQVCREIQSRQHFWRDRKISTLYFGGGTPSLIDPELILAICKQLANSGFDIMPNSECTIEINPATITEAKLDAYEKIGINRFSVGAQTFNDELLRSCGRRHSAQDTRDTLHMLRSRNLNYSFDLLFALPSQNLKQLHQDLLEVLDFSPNHLSAYCLTVPENHPMSMGRAPEGEQVTMFDLIEEQLMKIGLVRYEISNFARPGFESKHNQAYWNDSDYWGIGLSSHSYLKILGQFGARFWNSKSLKEYERQCDQSMPPDAQMEYLQQHELLTDFCHIHLRTLKGLPADALRKRFGPEVFALVEPRLLALENAGLLTNLGGAWTLSSTGQLLSNKVFEKLTFLGPELVLGTLTHKGHDSYCAV